jgi:tyrosyl-tRNA synthetase
VGADLPTLVSSRGRRRHHRHVQLFVRAGLAKSGKEAKRLIAENGARIDDAPAHRSRPAVRRLPPLRGLLRLAGDVGQRSGCRRKGEG